jgi:hypothetical protein
MTSIFINTLIIYFWDNLGIYFYTYIYNLIIHFTNKKCENRKIRNRK